jgi:replication factor C subunit 2/4
VDDVASQEDIIKSLNNAVKSGSIPHMLFYGPPGTGKTSTVLAMARDLFGPDLFRSRSDGAKRFGRERHIGGSRKR